jgi:hypothetical protein
MKPRMEKVRFRYIQPITIICNVNIENLYEIIEKNLEYNDGLNIYGFNKKTQEFWGKKIIKSVNKLHFNLSIRKLDYSQSYITITLEQFYLKSFCICANVSKSPFAMTAR